MFAFIRKQSPARIIALGFALLIFLGSVLLMLPCSLKSGVRLRYIDSLYTSVSAVCVTGLIAADAGDTFTLFGQIVVAVLIQVGGLGVASVGAGFMLAVGKKMDFKGNNLVKEAMNLDSVKGTVAFLKKVFTVTIIFELVGAIFSFAVFVRDFPPLKAVWISVFHSIASFNNAGFDVLGGGHNLIPYKDDVLLNTVTNVLVIFGGLGFLVIDEIVSKKFRFRRFSMHTKVVLTMTAALLFVGTVLIKLTENISWLGAFFFSVSARTAGFSTYPLSDFTNSGLLIIIGLMIIGASPGSTGGGVKTTTFFALLEGIKSSATNKSEKAFRYSLPRATFRKAAVIISMAIGVVAVGTYLMTLFEPELSLRDILFEVASAFGTVGLSTGITSELCDKSKILSIIIMYIGRLGPMTIATLWYFDKGERVRHPEGNISIG